MTSTTTRSLPARVGGAISALSFCFGIPALMVRAAGWPLPRRLPTLSVIGDALTGGWRPDDRVVISVLALIGWVVWAQIATCTVAELRTARSGRAGPTLPLSAWCRPIAVRLAATLAILAPFAPRAASAAPAPRATPAPITVSVAVAPAAAPAAPEAADARTIHVVRPGDTLWDLAADHLGNPMRWRELFDTNRGRPQPDGNCLDDPGLLRPGWQLTLPTPPAPPEAPVTVEAAPPAPAAAAAPAAVTDPPTDPTTAAAAPTAATTLSTDSAPPAAPEQRVPAAAAPVAPANTFADGSEAGTHTTSMAKALAQVGLPSLTAGVMLGYLGALRKDRERWRRRHHRFPKSSPAQAAAERRVRAVVRGDAPVWVDRSLRHLAASLQAEGAPPPPAVLGVRAGDLGVEILISPPWPVAPGRFLPLDDGHTWRLDPTVDLDELTALTADVPAYVPALVTVGDTDSGPLLIDLDEAGTLLLEGAADQVNTVLAAMAAELASAVWAENCDVHLIGVDPRLGGFDRVRVLNADDALGSLLPTASPPGTGGLADGARGDIPAAPTIAVVGPGALEPDDLDALLTAAQPHSGLAVIAAGSGVGGRVRLVGCPDGTAVLYPLGLAVQLATSAPTADHLVDLLAATASRGTDRPIETTTTSTACSAEVAPPEVSGADKHHEAPGEDARDPDPSADDEVSAAPAAIVRLLGPVEITWQGPTPKRQVAELVSYLAAHPRGVTYDQGRLALWPATEDDDRFGERAPATFWSLTTKARNALGKDPDGNALILREGNNALRLSPAVFCDWNDFERLASAARANRERAPELLRRALSLVRGRPFQGAAWSWVEVERLDGAIEAAVADAACDLADLALETSDLDTARFAVNQGLLAVPQSEALLRAAMRVAGAAGDRDGVERAWRDARRLAAQLVALGEPEPETVALYQSLRQRNGDA